MKKEHWALLSLAVNLLQSFLKLVAGIFTGSLSLIGEAFHSFADSFVSLLAFFAILFSEKKSKRFPYGLYKLENLGAILIGVVLLLVAYEVFSRALSFQVSVREEYLGLGLGVVVFSLLSSLSLSFLERRAGKRLNSPALVADSYHTLTDALGSSLVLMSLLSVYMGYQLDAYFAMGVSALIAYTALSILKRELSVLLDVSVDAKTLEEVRSIILSFEEVKGIKHLFMRSSGGKLFADITLTLDCKSFIRAHEVVDSVEMALKEAFHNMEMVFIHYEPDDCSTKIAVLVDEVDEVASKFSTAKKAIIFQEGEKAKVLSLENMEEREISESLSQEGVKVVVSGHHPESPYAKAVLSKEGVFVWETHETNPYKALSEIAYNLKDVKAPDKEGQGHRPYAGH